MGVKLNFPFDAVTNDTRNPRVRSYNSGAQDKVASLETELEFLKRTLVDAKHEVEESRRDVKVGQKFRRHDYIFSVSYILRVWGRV